MNQFTSSAATDNDHNCNNYSLKEQTSVAILAQDSGLEHPCCCRFAMAWTIAKHVQQAAHSPQESTGSAECSMGPA
eukprot:1595822-Amphidinium_carterae.1